MNDVNAKCPRCGWPIVSKDEAGCTNGKCNCLCANYPACPCGAWDKQNPEVAISVPKEAGAQAAAQSKPLPPIPGTSPAKSPAFWLCCGDTNPEHNSDCKEAEMGHPERCVFATGEQHSVFALERIVQNKIAPPFVLLNQPKGEKAEVVYIGNDKVAAFDKLMELAKNKDFMGSELQFVEEGK